MPSVTHYREAKAAFEKLTLEGEEVVAGERVMRSGVDKK